MRECNLSDSMMIIKATVKQKCKMGVLERLWLWRACFQFATVRIKSRGCWRGESLCNELGLDGQADNRQLVTVHQGQFWSGIVFPHVTNEKKQAVKWCVYLFVRKENTCTHVHTCTQAHVCIHTQSCISASPDWELLTRASLCFFFSCVSSFLVQLSLNQGNDYKNIIKNNCHEKNFEAVYLLKYACT